MFKKISLLFLLAIMACQTAQQKSLHLVANRTEQLKPLSTWKSTWCQLEVELTQPTQARYQEMFPQENVTNTMRYTWRALESSCEILPNGTGQALKNQQAFLETSLCLLLQVHYVNSPFDELIIKDSDVEAVGEVTHIRSGKDPALGIFLPSEKFVLETRTRNRGVLKAEYSEYSRDLWLPSRLEQSLGDTLLRVDDIEYGTEARPLIKSFLISVGSSQKPIRQSKVSFTDCRH